jgi:hypothetical protein
MPASVNGFADKAVDVTPCPAVQAFLLFGAITGILGVDIDAAARKLEAAVRCRSRSR